MRRVAIACVMILAASWTGAWAAETDTWEDDFSKPTGTSYYPAWPVRDGKLQYPSEKWGRHESAITRDFTEGEIEVTSAAVRYLEVGGKDFACTGLLVKRVGELEIPALIDACIMVETRSRR